ncbi:hypothetical protein AAVH_11116 [Aphelenchoides avenae]|nr:hypothetical protein AAVH_11116 [Aphelenchus avenae]
MAFSLNFLLAMAALAIGFVDAQQCTGLTFTGPCLVVAGVGNCPTPGELCDQSVPLPQGPQCCKCPKKLRG